MPLDLKIRKATFLGVLFAFLMNILGPMPACAQNYVLPMPGVMVHLSPEFKPAILRGLTIHRNDPFSIDFFINKGEGPLPEIEKKEQYQDLVKYFLAALAIPDEDQWVNLSPYEKNRIIADNFSKTIMGRDLLAEDYMLKEITASLIYPEDAIGKKFWKRIYIEAQKKFGTTNVPVNTFNKVWIVPERAVVYENARSGTVYIVESKLKVMLEEDYLSMQKHLKGTVPLKSRGQPPSTSLGHPNISKLGSDIIREIVIPELTREVNEGRNFAKLRQIYSAMILATWYKKALKKGMLAKIYTDKAKVKGIDQDPQNNEAVYRSYLKAFKKGVYNYIKEEPDPNTQTMIPRKYFSGGFSRQETANDFDTAMLILDDPAEVSLPERRTFTAEAGAMEFVPVVLTPAEDKVMTTPGWLKSGLRGVALGLGMTGALALPVQAAVRAPEESSTMGVQQLIEAQGQFDGIQSGEDLNKTVEKFLNDSVNSYIYLHQGHLVTSHDHMPHLLAILNNSFIQPEQKSASYDLLVTLVRHRVIELQNKSKTHHISSSEQNELDGELSYEVVLLLQRCIVKHSTYQTFQERVRGVVVNRQFDCESLSELMLGIAKGMGLDNVYYANVSKDHEGRPFPRLVGTVEVGHAVNVVRGEHFVGYADQGNADNTPQEITVFDENGFPVPADANKIPPAFKLWSFEDRVNMVEAKIKLVELFTLVDAMNSHPYRVDDETMAKIQERMSWIDAHETLDHHEKVMSANVDAIHTYIAKMKARISAAEAGNHYEALVRPINDDFFAIHANVDDDMGKADNLFVQHRYDDAKAAYEDIARRVTSEYNRFKSLEDQFPYADKRSPVFSFKLSYLSAIAETAAKRAEAVEFLTSYTQLWDQMNSLKSKASTDYNSKDYQAAAENLAAVYRLINDNIDKLRQQSEAAEDNRLVDQDTKQHVSNAELIKGLVGAADDAKKDQNFALTEALNSLISRCDHLLKYPDPDKAKMKSKMMSIAEQAQKILNSQGKDMSKELRGTYNRLINLINKDIADSAMVIFGQPVGGIDFNSKNLDLQIEGDNTAMALSVDAAAGWRNIKIQGLIPTIIEIKPVIDWPCFPSGSAFSK